MARVDGLLRVGVLARIGIARNLVALGVAALVLRGWNVKIALVTLGFLIVASLVTFHKRTRGTELGRLTYGYDAAAHRAMVGNSVASTLFPRRARLCGEVQ